MSDIKTSSAKGQRAWWAIALIGTVLALGACDRSADNRSAGEKVDAAIARTEKAAEETREKTEQMARDARAKVDSSDAATRIAQAAKDAGNAVVAAADDATITAAVNAGLAKDPDLSAVKINVDTDRGKVTLSGPAPNPQAKERAEQIAKQVAGVSTVENKLEVRNM